MMISVRGAGVCAVFITAAGVGSLNWINERQKGGRLRIASANTKTDFQADSVQAILQLQDDLKGMTRKEKIQRAYDGAVRTHEIGFPTTAPNKRP